MTITEALTADHRHGDDLFDNAILAAGSGDWAAAAPALERFIAALKRHMQIEEDDLFPAFERVTGNRGGPTAVMRIEHRQMLATLDRLSDLVRSGQAEALDAVARSFTELMTLHSTKEENILYPMCDRVLDADAELKARIASELAS